jgi:hypothetical protein
MPRQTTAQLLKNIDHRLANVEQILPALATKAELAAAIAPLATKAELAAAIAPLATRAELAELRAEVKEEGRETRRHFDVVAESLRSDIRMIAEGHVHLAQRLDAFEVKTERSFTNVDKRLLRLEAKQGLRRG